MLARLLTSGWLGPRKQSLGIIGAGFIQRNALLVTQTTVPGHWREDYYT